MECYCPVLKSDDGIRRRSGGWNVILQFSKTTLFWLTFAPLYELTSGITQHVIMVLLDGNSHACSTHSRQNCGNLSTSFHVQGNSHITIVWFLISADVKVDRFIYQTKAAQTEEEKFFTF